MKNLRRFLPVLFLFLTACSFPVQGVTLPAPHSGNCYFVESRQGLPELSQKVNQSLQALDTAATGRAYAYGEDCVYEDGTRVFHAMETDFPVQIQVKNIHDEKALGDWIYNVMQAIQKLPSDQVPGGPGRVEFEFMQSESETFHLIVRIGRYQSEAAGLRGAELFQFFSQDQ